MREKDGLAMSSRNAYLSPAERKVAPVLHRAMKATAAAIKSGTSVSDAVAQGRSTIEQAGFALDYFEARHAETLAPVQTVKDGAIRLLVAAKIGTTRLIDNIRV
jgi:pantoate--beta-alanine ligase